MKRWIFDNFGLKVLAVFIAIALWAYVGSRQIMDQRYQISLELTDIPAGMKVDPDSVKPSISVIFHGKRDDVVGRDPTDFKVVVSLKGYSQGQKEMVVHPRLQPMPTGVIASVADLTIRLIPLEENKEKKKGSKT
jgi:YbbR domain-containing protein